MRSDRLLALTLLLLGRKNVTAGELATRFEISTRTVYRDIELLAQAGVPVYASRGTGGGIRIMEGYTLDRNLFTQEEQDDLLLAVQTLQVSRRPGAAALLEKVSTIVKAKPVEWLKIDVTAWGDMGCEAEERFLLIRQATLAHQQIAFDYIDGEGQRSQRRVDPLSLLYKGNSWYLNAWCTTRNAERMFRLSRMRNLVNTQVPFGPHEDVPEQAHVHEPLVNLVLRFHPRCEQRLLDEFAEEYIHRDADGFLWVHPRYPPGEWVYGFLLSFGPDVEVHAPPEVRAEVVQRLKRALVQYARDAADYVEEDETDKGRLPE